MPPSKKGGKSSASSATRKKQAAKAAKKSGEDPKAAAASASASTAAGTNGSQRGQKKDKKSKKELKNRKKVFIPPPKPPQPPPDPLDTLGLASLLPPGLVVLLRKAAKKDVITRSRALEGLLSWIDAKDEEGESAALGDEERDSALVMMLPSWVHLFPRLAASPNSRLRLMTAQILAKLLDSSLSTRSELLLAPQYTEAILGPWSTLAWDTDKATSNVARGSWDEAVSWPSENSEEGSKLYLPDYLATLANFLSTLLVQGSTSTTLSSSSGDPQLSRGNSYAPGVDGARDAKNRDDTNVEEDSKATNARLAAAALGALTWVLTTYKAADECEELVNLLHSDALWTALYATPHSQSEASPVQSFGVDYPVTRSRAWVLLSTVTSQHPQLLGQILHIVAPIALEAAWEERGQSVVRNMLDALLPMLSRHNEAWSIRSDTEEDSDEDDESSDEEEGDAAGADGNAARSQPSGTLAGFQEWIQSGCGGSPRLGLPAVLVLVSTIPASVLPPTRQAIGTFLDLFWSSREASVYDSDRLAQREVLKSFAECSAYLIGKLSKSDLEATADVSAEQLGNKLWTEEVLPSGDVEEGGRSATLASLTLTRAQEAVDERIVSTTRNLAKLGEEGAVVRPLLEIIRSRLQEVADGSTSCQAASISRAANILASLGTDTSPPLLQSWATELAVELADASASSLNKYTESAEAASIASRTVLLSELLQSCKASGVPPIVDEFAQSTIGSLVQTMRMSPEAAGGFLSAYLQVASKESASRHLVAVIEAAAGITEPKIKVQTLQAVLDGVPTGAFAESDFSSNTKLDDVVLAIASDINGGSAAADGESLLSRLIDQPRPFIETGTVNEVLALLISRLHSVAHDAIVGRGGSTSSFQQAERIASILAKWSKGEEQRAQYLVDSNLFEAAATAAFGLHFLAQRSAPEAAKLWKNLTALQDAEKSALSTLREKLSDVQVETVIVLEGARKYFASSQTTSSLSMLEILPSQESMDNLLYSTASSLRTPASLSILDPLAASAQEGRSAATHSYDTEGLSEYARSAYALLLFLEESRSVARSQPWALPHIVMLALLCEDEMQMSGGAGGLLQSDKFTASSKQCTHLRHLLDRCIKVSSSMLAALCGSLPETWHTSATETLQKKPDAPSQDDATLQIMASLWRASIAQQAPTSTSHLTRIFSRLLAGVLSFTSAGEQEGTKWMRLAQAVESKAPHLSEAIIYPAKSYVFDTPLYDRQRNDIVSRLASTVPPKANTEGLTLLRLAVAIAPPPESSMVFVPQQRVVFLLQGLQRWVASDEDLDEEINTRLAELFLHVAPLVQEMPGSHLDFFYDLIESNLEVSSSLSEEPALPTLFHSLKLLELLDELSVRNSLLRDVWKEHQESVVELLQPLFKSLALSEGPSSSSRLSMSSVSVAKEMTAELLVGVVRQHQKAFQTDEYYATFCELLESPMREVQVAAFRLLAGSIRTNVRELVLESALEKEGDERPRVTLAPAQLLVSASRRIDVTAEDLEEEVELSRQVMSYLLAWLAIFEHFEEASVQLKSIYAGQLQQDGLLANSLLPTVFSLLEPRKSRRNKDGQMVGPFDPDRYSVDEIFVDLLEPKDSSSIRQLATHIYFRALLYTPTLVREWWLGTKDRQLSLGVASFTTRHCSPLIASRELGQLREPEALSRLQDEAMSIRILGANEVVGTYTIDEHPMEIGIKIPHDYPLHGVEVRDIRRVGVSEAQWRAWLLGVQQLIVSQNGLVFDALMLFKRNAEAKFAGFEDGECSICYSIISPTDRSLPTKPCRTCNKKFHASCLFKWVTSSGSSTCPLCRSVL
jgi:hypothetical protein